MKRKLLILFMLVAFLVILKSGRVVQADACTSCGTSYSSCSFAVVDAWDSWEFWYEQQAQDCINDGGLEWICQAIFNVGMDPVNGAYDSGIMGCENGYHDCVTANCGSSSFGGFGETFDCESPGFRKGYSAVGAAFYGGFMDQCVTGGADTFSSANLDPSGFNNCMANSGPEPDQATCCRAQISLYIQMYDICNLDRRNPDCKACYTF